MRIPCRKCGKLNNKPSAKSFEDLNCSNCGAVLLKKEPQKILTNCEVCDLAQQIPMDQYNGYRCKSCGAHNNHPIKKPINGAGYSLNVEFTKTTINIDNRIMEALDKELEKINHWEGPKKLKPAKVKKGQFIRMLLKEHFGFKL